MREHCRTQGIVLKKSERGESDRMFTVFTKDFGKLLLWAISERKITSKLRGGLELLYFSEIEFVQGKSKKTIIDASLVDSYAIIRSDLSRMRVALRILETLDAFEKDQVQDNTVWDILQNSLALLNNTSLPSKSYSLVYYYFFWNFVSHAGWQPQPFMYGGKANGMLHALLAQHPSFLLGETAGAFSTALLNEISKKHFLMVKNELH